MEVDGRIVAFAVGCRDGNVWALFVDPEHEGKGYGRQLQQTMLDWLWSQGLERVWLTTSPFTRAERFYLQSGWVNCGPTAKGEIRFEMTRPG